MSTAILDLDYEQLPAEVTGLAAYSRALVLIRLRGRPVGQTVLTVRDGRVAGADLREAVRQTIHWPFWEQWIYNYLEWEPARGSQVRPVTATVAICTRDRPDDLRRCLEGLVRLPDDGQVILVVDNCPSTDATRRLVEGFAGVRYVREDRPGLDCARNRALREAAGEVVAFIDDDAVPDPGWLRGLVANFDHPLVLCVTGLTMPLELETEAQEWFEKYTAFGRGFRRRVFDPATHNPLLVGQVGAGVNMALRRKVIELVGPFDEALDAGTPTRSGGDHDMFSRILAAGYWIVYEPAALNWHRHRPSWPELRRTIYGYGVGVYAMWTRSLLVDGELTVPKLAWSWFSGGQLKSLVRSILRWPGSAPLDLVLAELRGCAAGPRAYLASRKRLQTEDVGP